MSSTLPFFEFLFFFCAWQARRRMRESRSEFLFAFLSLAPTFFKRLMPPFFRHSSPNLHSTSNLARALFFCNTQHRTTMAKDVVMNSAGILQGTTTTQAYYKSDIIRRSCSEFCLSLQPTHSSDKLTNQKNGRSQDHDRTLAGPFLFHLARIQRLRL